MEIKEYNTKQTYHDLYPVSWLKMSIVLLLILLTLSIFSGTYRDDLIIPARNMHQIAYNIGALMAPLFLSGMLSAIPMFIVRKTTLVYKKLVYIFATIGGMSLWFMILYILLTSLDINVSIWPFLLLPFVFFLISLILSILPFLFTVIKLFLPKNSGVKRLCVFVGIFSFFIIWASKIVSAIPFATLAFCTPFILAKIIEYIVDGFKQE